MSNHASTTYCLLTIDIHTSCRESSAGRVEDQRWAMDTWGKREFKGIPSYKWYLLRHAGTVRFTTRERGHLSQGCNVPHGLAHVPAILRISNKFSQLLLLLQITRTRCAIWKRTRQACCSVRCKWIPRILVKRKFSARRIILILLISCVANVHLYVISHLNPSHRSGVFLLNKSSYKFSQNHPIPSHNSFTSYKQSLRAYKYLIVFEISIEARRTSEMWSWASSPCQSLNAAGLVTEVLETRKGATWTNECFFPSGNLLYTRVHLIPHSLHSLILVYQSLQEIKV